MRLVPKRGLAVERLERDLDALSLEDLADDFPLLQSLVDCRAGGQKRLPLPGRGRANRHRSSRTCSAVTMDRAAKNWGARTY